MEFIGKTVEETIENGLKELNLAEENAEITVIEQPTKGLFGRMKGKAVVEIKRKKTDEDNAVEFVQGIVDIMNLNATATLTERGENTTITLSAEDNQAIIGYRGEVLDAIQTLASAAANIGKKEAFPVPNSTIFYQNFGHFFAAFFVLCLRHLGHTTPYAILLYHTIHENSTHYFFDSSHFFGYFT